MDGILWGHPSSPMSFVVPYPVSGVGFTVSIPDEIIVKLISIEPDEPLYRGLAQVELLLERHPRYLVAMIKRRLKPCRHTKCTAHGIGSGTGSHRYSPTSIFASAHLKADRSLRRWETDFSGALAILPVR